MSRSVHSTHKEFREARLRSYGDDKIKAAEIAETSKPEGMTPRFGIQTNHKPPGARTFAGLLQEMDIGELYILGGPYHIARFCF
jgi:hypothetical protein